MTAATLQALALGLWAVAATRQVTACLYALGDTRTPVWGGVVALIVKIGASLALMGRISPPVEANWLAQGVATLSGLLSIQQWGVVGLAAATSLAALANLVFQAARLSRRFSRLSVATMDRLSAVERPRLGRNVDRTLVVCGAGRLACPGRLSSQPAGESRWGSPDRRVQFWCPGLAGWERRTARLTGHPTRPPAWPPATIPPAASVRCDRCPPGCARAAPRCNESAC